MKKNFSRIIVILSAAKNPDSIFQVKNWILRRYAPQNDIIRKSFLLLTVVSNICFAQYDSTSQSVSDLNMDAVYRRPFLRMGSLPVSLGGYVETNSSYFSTDGVSEGLSFQVPRVTIFISSGITQRIKFLSEIELEEGGREINIEFASVDVEFHPLFNMRGGVVMNPIGSFNQNHDGPKWEFVSRPLSSTTIIPSTWSNVGFGLFGKSAFNNIVWAYEAYLTNGFDDKIITNEENRTWLPSGKLNTERFEESFNGVPLVTLKTAIRHHAIGEVGVSWMGGVFNKFEEDGLTFDKQRRVDVFAVDFNSTIPYFSTSINAEWVWAFIDVPATYTQQYGDQQQGGYIDFVQPIWKEEFLDWRNSTLNVALRLEYVDYNVGTFRETGRDISDETIAVAPGISFRPSQQTVFRANYRYHWEEDFLGNPPAQTAGFQFGFSTYF